jgi:hypothetical protein
VFLSVPVVHVLQMAMIEIINVILMLNGGVAAACAVDVGSCASRLIGGGHWFGLL